MTQALRLDVPFWSAFAERYWEQRPTVLRGVAGAPLLDAEELLAALNAVSAAWRGGSEPVFGLWVNGRTPRPPFDRYLPESTDPSLDDYVRRVVDDGDEFCLTQFDLQYWWPPAMDRVQTFVAGLVGQLGLPVVDVDVDTFVGRYRQTPRGIHRDPASTFMFVVEGLKCITVWPPDSFRSAAHHVTGRSGKEVVHGLDLAEAPPGLELVGGPGDVLYWPSSYWHAAHAADASAVTAAVNVGLYLEPRSASITDDVVRAVLRDAGLQPGHHGSYEVVRCESSVALPPRERRLLDLLANLMTTGTLERLVHAEWMHRVSAGGVTATPPLLPIATLPTRAVRGAESTVLWYIDGDEVVVSARGHGARFPRTDGVVSLFDAVAVVPSGEPFDLGGLVVAGSDAAAAARWIVATGALTAAAI